MTEAEGWTTQRRAQRQSQKADYAYCLSLRFEIFGTSSRQLIHKDSNRNGWDTSSAISRVMRIRCGFSVRQLGV